MEGAPRPPREGPGPPPARAVRGRPRSGTRLTAEGEGLFLDYSKHRSTDETIGAPRGARPGGGRARSAATRCSPASTSTRPRIARSCIPRCGRRRRALVESTAIDVVPDVHEVLDRMADFAMRVRNGEWTGFTGSGSGTSSTSASAAPTSGPRWRPRRCATTRTGADAFRFVSNVDGADIREAIERPRPGRDAVHRQQQDLHDARDDDQRPDRRDWLLAKLARRRGRRAHFVAVSTNAEKVAKFGIDTANMFGFWDWVGGRYSMDSAIGLSLMIAIGPDNFREMLAGFRAMDEHFLTTPLRAQPAGADGPARHLVQRLLRLETHAVLPYSQELTRFPAYLQQLDMESNGKSVRLDGERVDVRHRADRLGHRRHQRPARLLPAAPPGHPDHAGGPDRVRRPHDRGRRPARPADGEPVRAGRGVRVRQDARAGASPTACPTHQVAARVFEGNRPTSVILADRLTPGRSARSSRCTSTRCRPGRDLGDRLVRPVGRGAGQGAGDADRRAS